MRTGTCPRCGAPVVWAVTLSGHRQPLNPAPHPAGNVAAYRDHLGTWRARTLHDQEFPAAHEHVYMPHHATCTAQPAAGGQLPANVIPIRRRKRRSK